MTRTICFLFAATCLLAPSQSVAGIVVALSDDTLISGPTVQRHTIDVFVDLTDADDGGSIEVANFQVRTVLTGVGAGTDVAIVGVDNAVSAAHPQGRPLDIISLVSSTEAFGSTFNFGPSFVLDDLDGLLSVTLEVQPNVTGQFSLEIVPGDGNTQFTDPIDFISNLPFTSSSGQLAVSVVPEPAGMGLFALAVTGTVSYRWRRRRGQSKPAEKAA
ncbi:MAG: hypothetical protein MI861_26705 [Pirellulales bacterium]|nr:hypothetical protein [Pirellulales bacterium]